MNKRLTAIFGIVAMAITAMACGGKVADAPTAAAPTITKLAFGKTETAEPAVTTFDIADGIFAVATVSNPQPKLTVDFTVTCENVKGKEKGWNVMNKLTDVQGGWPVSLHFSVADPGEYRIEAGLYDDTGQKIDSRSGTVTVTGEPLPLESEEKDRDKDKDRDRDRDNEKDKKRDNDRDKDRDRDKR